MNDAHGCTWQLYSQSVSRPDEWKSITFAKRSAAVNRIIVCVSASEFADGPLNVSLQKVEPLQDELQPT
jgi:hypothetical protein